MGLSASQARYLMLVAKQSDLQYQGQQINQERTVLSQQVSELYNSLLAMEVPTPPSTTDFQKIKYAGAIGTSQYSFYASSVKPQGKVDGIDKYTIDFGLTAYGDSLATGNYQTAKATKNGDGTFTYTINGQTVSEVSTNYYDAINNAQIKDAQGNVYGPDDFYMYTTTTTSGDTTSTTVHFALKKDVHSAAEKDGMVTQVLSYTYSPTGRYTKTVTKSDCELHFDVSTGRITTVTLPIGKDASGEDIMQTIDVAASTETDEVAYQDAYAQYEYKKYLYDKEQQDINAKTEIIQQEDRNLELKLQRLDTENNEIKTELDAVKEVLKNNIEGSYKTFSG